MKRGAVWAAVLFVCSTPVWGFVSYVNSNGQALRWNLVSPSPFVHTNVVNRVTKAVRYFVGSDLYSAANRTNELNSIRACFDQWQSVPGSVLKFEEGGLAPPGVDINTSATNNTNVVFWAKTSTLVNGGFDDIHGLKGYTVTAFLNDNTLVAADIVLNGVEFTWFTDFNQTERADTFVESVLLHEIGHFIGLDHSPVGGATVTAGGPGIDTEAGLSSDEIAAVHALYPQPATTAALGHLRGRVLLNGAGVFGAMLTAENADGNVVAGTVSRANGAYELLAMPPGNYLIRATPLDPSSADLSSSLMRGVDIGADYESAATAFLPTTNKLVQLGPGATNTLDFTVLGGNPPFRIAGISRPTVFFDGDTADRFAATIRRGVNNLYVGVASISLPTSAATLRITGDGVTLGAPIFKPRRFVDGSNVILIPISVAADATPGLRSFVVEQGTNAAYANGYLEILPPFPDFNFDGLDDRFQRQFFPVFTAAEAGPEADPDGDGFNNRFEFETGSDPTDRLSVHFRILGVKRTPSASTITFQSAAGKRYQLFRSASLDGAAWEPVGNPVPATGTTAEATDATAGSAVRFYRVQALP